MKRFVSVLCLFILGTAAIMGQNNALRFYTHGDDYVQISRNCLAGITNQMTLEAWVKPDLANTSGRIIDNCTPGGTDGFLLDLYDGVPRVIIKDVGVSATTSIAAGTWAHVAAVYNGSQILIFVNGVQEGSQAFSEDVPTNSYEVRLAKDQTYYNHFGGVFDEVRIWKIALSAAYLNATKNCELNGTEYGLNGYWPLNESASPAVDKTPNGNNGGLFDFYGSDGFESSGVTLSAADPDGTLSGNGTEGSPYLVGSYSQLKLVGTLYPLSAVYRLTANIDASASATEDGGSGFLPIGDLSKPFTGTFHGSGFIIDQLHINRPALEYTGLIGDAANSSVLDSIGLTNVSIAGASATGALVGRSSGMIRCAYSTGSVSGVTYVGGLVGYADTITNSYSSAAVSGTNNVGGLVGAYRILISKSYASGSVTASGTYAGGLAGAADDNAAIADCYARGNASANDCAGGLIGSAWGTVTHCYATGSVSSPGANGGLIGTTWQTTIEHCYWNKEVYTGTCIGSKDNATTLCTDTAGYSSVQLQFNGTYTGWDGGIWSIDAGTNDGYPYLQWQNPGGSPLPVQLAAFSAAATGGNATLTWSTSTETGNSGFDIERRRVPESVWTRIGFVAGNGTSTQSHTYTYVDNTVSAGRYAYRLKQIDRSGNGTYSQSAEVVLDAPSRCALGQNYPNPFNPSTTIRFEVPASGLVTLKVYNVLGQEVAVLVNETKEAGRYESTWNARTAASGVYFYRLTAGSFSAVKRMTVTK